MSSLRYKIAMFFSIVLLMPTLPVYATEASFSDIEYTAKTQVVYSLLKKHDIFHGYPNGTFQPDQTINRAEIMAVVMRSFYGDLSVHKFSNCFPDVKEEWFAPYICFAKKHGIVHGYPDGLFRPADPVNKVEFLKMAIEARELTLERKIQGKDYIGLLSRSFDDLDSTAWYVPYVGFALERGVVIDEKGELFQPETGAIRSYVAETMFNIILDAQRTASFTTWDPEWFDDLFDANKDMRTLHYLWYEEFTPDLSYEVSDMIYDLRKDDVIGENDTGERYITNQIIATDIINQEGVDTALAITGGVALSYNNSLGWLQIHLPEGKDAYDAKEELESVGMGGVVNFILAPMLD